MVKWILIALLALPIAEISVFILVAASIGLLWAVALMVATTVAGLAVLRMVGRGRFALFRSVVTDSGVAGIEARLEANPHGFLLVLGGILLVLPGFITDAVGLLLLIAPIRQWCGWQVRRASGRQARTGEPVIDLEKSEWRQVPEGRLENHRHGNDKS